jgi:hypothetical protein
MKRQWVQVEGSPRWMVHRPDRDLGSRLAVVDYKTGAMEHVPSSSVRRRGKPCVAMGRWSGLLGVFDRTKRITVHEDWYPTTGCQVTARILATASGWWRVCVWGGDDFGLELDTPDEHRAWRLYHRIRPFITQAQLRRWGMVDA